jgi:hypothetical protein
LIGLERFYEARVWCGVMTWIGFCVVFEGVFGLARTYAASLARRLR